MTNLGDVIADATASKHVLPDGVPRLPVIEIEPEGGTFTTGPRDTPITDWSEILLSFGLNPDHFTVVDDTVRISKWQQSKGHADGTRDVVWLYSYRARFRRVTDAERTLAAELAQAVERVRAWKPARPAKTGTGPEVVYAHVQGDEQAGQDGLAGLELLAENQANVLQNAIQNIKRLRKAGHNIVGILDCATGDVVENVMGHYASQPRSTATLRAQLGFAVEADITRTLAFAELGLPITKVYTPSNHGEIRPGLGADPLTSASDNLDLVVAEAAERWFYGRAASQQITWHIPHDEWVTVVTVNGVTIGVTHGHKVKGKPADWLRLQRDYFNFHHGKRLQIMFMGHRHHHHTQDVSGTTLIQASTLGRNGDYWEAATGERATHGAVGLLIDPTHPMGWHTLSTL